MPATVVVTGSTKGLGLGLVSSFLDLGANVVVSGRGEESVRTVVRELGARFPEARIFGKTCNVSSYEDVKSLWDASVERFGRVDLWINNAGTSNAQRAFVEQPAEQIESVVCTNLLGVMYASRVALEGMQKQTKGGAIYNMEGFGADGARQRGMALYGSTKRALRYFTHSLVDETKNGSVIVGTASPGIVVTDLWCRSTRRAIPTSGVPRRGSSTSSPIPSTWSAPWLAKRLLENNRHGAHLAWMTVLKGAMRFLNPKYYRRELFPRALPRPLKNMTAADKRVFAALVFTFCAHGLAMLGMLLFLLPMVPGGGGAGGDLERVVRIAASPMSYRLGWLGWQITALSDVLFAIALLRAPWAPRGWAIAQLVFVILAVIPDQGAQLLLVTRGIDLAREAAATGDVSTFIAFENTMFPLTSGWAALLYTLAAIAWAVTFEKGARWNRALRLVTIPMLTLFVAISVAPVLPLAIRPKAELIGGGNALGFTILEAWFVAAMVAVRKKSVA